MEKKLYRSRTDRVIAGVCGGFAAYFNVTDTTWIRLVWALLTIAAGLSVWIYILCWIVIPEEPMQIGPVDEQ